MKKYTNRTPAYRGSTAGATRASCRSGVVIIDQPARPVASVQHPQGNGGAVPISRGFVQIQGDKDFWVLIQKAFDPASKWTKTTRAANVPGGVVINTCSRRRGGGDAVAEAIVLVPGCRVTPEGQIASA
jgi:hypothetical protein